MDTLLVGGDHELNSRGIPVKIGGTEEIIQRALIRLSIKRGTFPQDPSLGSELYKLRGYSGDNISRMALAYVQEALSQMPEISVSEVTLAREGADSLIITVSIKINGEIYPLEVEID